MINYYKILGLPETADIETIKDKAAELNVKLKFTIGYFDKVLSNKFLEENIEALTLDIINGNMNADEFPRLYPKALELYANLKNNLAKNTASQDYTSHNIGLLKTKFEELLKQLSLEQKKINQALKAFHELNRNGNRSIYDNKISLFSKVNSDINSVLSIPGSNIDEMILNYAYGNRGVLFDQTALEIKSVLPIEDTSISEIIFDYAHP